VLFLFAKGRDAVGRYFDDILEMDDFELEIVHDYVQWLFPLPTFSSAVASAPILSRADIAAIRDSHSALENLRRATDRMRRFYDSNDTWLVAHNHNHLRITRIIRCLRILVGQKEAEEFFHEIMVRVAKAGQPVSLGNIRYWRDALS
jgi:hypothetical protein